MDSNEKPSKDILRALEKMDLEAAELLQTKNREIKRRKKQTPLVQEIDRLGEIKKQNIDDHNKLLAGIKNKGIVLFLVFLLTLMLTYTLTKEARTTLIENTIILILICGMVAAKKR